MDRSFNSFNVNVRTKTVKIDPGYMDPNKSGRRDFFTLLLSHPLFFFVYRRMRFPILGRSVGLKKNNNNLKKHHKTSRNSRPWYPRATLKVNIHLFGLTKCKKCSCFCSCFSLRCYYAHFSD